MRRARRRRRRLSVLLLRTVLAGTLEFRALGQYCRIANMAGERAAKQSAVPGEGAAAPAASVATAAGATAPRQINLAELSVEQLSGLKQRVEAEARQIEGSVAALAEAGERYARSLQTARTLGADAPQRLLIPLTSSMYAHGVTKGDGMLTVDLGTGFFARLPAKEAEAVLERKLDYVRTNLSAFKTQLRGKRSTLAAVSQVLQVRIQERVGGTSSLPSAAATS